MIVHYLDVLKLEYHITDQSTNHTFISVSCHSVQCACRTQVVHQHQIENLIMAYLHLYSEVALQRLSPPHLQQMNTFPLMAGLQMIPASHKLLDTCNFNH